MRISYFFVALFAVLTYASCKKSNPEPTIDFTYSNNIGQAPDPVSFRAEVKNANSVKWFFGDGATGEGIDVKHVYSHAGYYSVQATAIGDGGTLSRFKNINVSPYTQLRITNVSTAVPSLKPDGTTWDADPVIVNRNPDLRVIVYNSSGAEIMNDHNVAYNVFSAGFNFIPSAIVSDFEGSFSIKVFDYDDPGNMDLIGVLSYRPADYMTDTTSAFPTSFSKNNGMGLSVGVNVVWD